jgi:cell division protein FtsN
MQLYKQHGGTFLGFIIGLLVGLGVALAVAIYVTQVATPFSNKNQPRTNDQNVQETEKNKDWNPNNVFQPKPSAEAPQAPVVPAVPAAPSVVATPTVESAADKATAGKNPAETSKPEPRPAAITDPLGDLAKAKAGLSTPPSAGDAADHFEYLVQVGAYRTSSDADAQKAKLAFMGLEARVSERDQAGRTVYRVRLGPFTEKSAAERIRARLESSGIENTLVRVQR